MIFGTKWLTVEFLRPLCKVVERVFAGLLGILAIDFNENTVDKVFKLWVKIIHIYLV